MKLMVKLISCEIKVILIFTYQPRSFTAPPPPPLFLTTLTVTYQLSSYTPLSSTVTGNFDCYISPNLLHAPPLLLATLIVRCQPSSFASPSTLPRNFDFYISTKLLHCPSPLPTLPPVFLATLIVTYLHISLSPTPSSLHCYPQL